ncbi:MAG: EAL domain-containing protein [Campylobacterota bacterium]|nr:EAL domain-containing protein [Campylobacterota bacterium]
MNNIEDITTCTKQFTVLCVDDEEKSRIQLEDLFSMFFKEVYIASNGLEALDIYTKNKNKIDIVFTDISMPQMDGIDLSENIKTIDPLQYVVTISAHQELDFYNKAINIGVNGMIIKPITSQKVLNILSKAIKTISHIKAINNPTADFTHTDNSDFVSEIYKDTITGLDNKIKLDMYLNTKQEYTAILVNIDNFDLINCKYGYTTGDQVLKQVGKFLSSLVQDDTDKLFRVVSDEFLFLVSNDKEKSAIENFSKNIISTLEYIKIQTPIDEFHISCTIGISSGIGLDIIREAHIALKEAREIGKHKYYFFSNNSQLIQKRQNSLKWLSKIKKILKEDCLIPYYQPIIDNKNKQIVMYESLARILELNRVVKPYYFLENAKLFNLTPHLGKIIVSKVFEYFKDKEDPISINITQDDLMSDSFVEYIEESANRYNIDPSKVIFEIFENITINKDKTVIKNINKLHHYGFKIALDDFGTNEMSILNLHTIHIDFIKIDATFIETILENEQSEKIVNSIIKLASNIGAKTIAESVSSEEIFKAVQELGIDYSQGYYIGKPKEFI